jgi:hypothetical protein
MCMRHVHLPPSILETHFQENLSQDMAKPKGDFAR